MSEPGAVVRKAAFIGFALVLMVCVAMSFQHRDEILGGFALRGAQTSFEERVRADLGADTAIEYRDSSERSAALVVTVTHAAARDLQADTELVWRAYSESFAAGGMPIDRVVVAAGEGTLESPVAALVRDSGVPAPPLHPMYADKGYFDPSKEAVPAEDAGTDE